MAEPSRATSGWLVAGDMTNRPSDIDIENHLISIAEGPALLRQRRHIVLPVLSKLVATNSTVLTKSETQCAWCSIEVARNISKPS